MWDPFGASTTNITSWKSSPNERGTINILSTCIITLVLCIYSCLHLNISGPEQKTFVQRFKRKSLWLLLGLFAPEFVAYVAFYDWLYAKNMEARMKRFLDPLHSAGERAIALPDVESGDGTSAQTDMQPEDLQQTNRRKTHNWTRTHSHYALMGGFVFDMSKLAINFAPRQVARLTLVPDAILYLAEHEAHILPDISEGEIKDKSKADDFAKILVCLQALWFLAQIIGRLATRHLISLLEVNTLLHALCCLIVYAAWWHKPLDIEEPTLIDPQRALVTCAYMVSTMNYHTYEVFGTREPKKLFVTLNYDDNMSPEVSNNQSARGPENTTDRASSNQERSSTSMGNTTRENQQKDPEMPNQPDTSDWESLMPAKDNSHYRLLYEKQKFRGYYFQTEKVRYRNDHYIRLPLEDIECLANARRFRGSPRPTQFAVWAPFGRPGMLRFQAVPFHHTDTSLKRWPDSLRQRFEPWMRGSKSLDDSLLSVVYVLGLLAASTVYGGVHMIAWQTQFASIAERYIWQISCCVIACPFPLATLLILVVKLYNTFFTMAPTMQLKRSSCITKKLIKVWSLLTIIVVFAFGIPYIVARIYLVAESFRNLGHMPQEVYVEPEWSKYIPHFGAG